MLFLRLVRVYRSLRDRKAFGAVTVVTMLLICLLGNSICYWYFDDEKFGDALWYSVISITTIGYGDFYAKSTGARIGTFIFIVIAGLATFSFLLGMLVDWTTEWASKGQRGMGKVIAKNHVLIVNFPSASRVHQLIEELKADPQYRGTEIVVVTDQIEQLPFDETNVEFIQGSILDANTYQRARIDSARLVIVLATSYSDPNSDAIVASAVSVVEDCNPSVHTVAECLDYRHRRLFASVNCDSIVFSLKLSGNLLAQEAHDHGVSQLVDVITSNIRGTTLYSTEVADVNQAPSYIELAKQLLDRDVNLLCVNRGEESLTSFVSLTPQVGDLAIYAASKRMTWSELVG